MTPTAKHESSENGWAGRRGRRGRATPAPAALLALLLCVPTLAAEPPEPAAEEEQDGEAPVATRTETLHVEDSLPYAPTSNTIATKLPVELAWTPAHVGVVGRLLFTEQGAAVLGDALHNVSGVHPQTGFGIFDHFVIRGFDSLSSGLVLTDGAPEPEVTFYRLYNVERVEVLKGPAGFLYGSNPLAGAVNLVRKQPLPASFASASAAAGSFGTYGTEVDVNHASDDGRLALRVNGAWGESDRYRDLGTSRVLAANPSLTWRPREGTVVNLNLEHLRWDAEPDAGLPVIEGGVAQESRRRSYGSSFDFSEQTLGRFQLDVETRLSERVTLRNKTYYRELDWQTDGTLISPFHLRERLFLVSRTLTVLDDRQRFLGNQLEAVTELTTGGVTHRLLTGVEVGRYGDVYSLGVAQLPAVTLGTADPRALDPAERPPVFPFGAGDSRSRVIAPYAIDQMVFSDRFQLLAGLRYDDLDFRDRVSGTERSDGEVSPLVGAVYAPVPGLTLYANAGRSFSPPSPRVVGDQRPERSRQAEAGARRELWGGRGRVSLAAYQIDRDNIAIPDQTGFTQQAGDQRSRGAELELYTRLGAGIDLFAAYAYTDSRLTRFAELVQFGPGPTDFVVLDHSGNRPAFAPEHLGSLWLSRRFANGFGVAGGARLVGEQFIAEDNEARLGSYALLDAALSYDAGSWGARLNLHNLTDREHETRGFGRSSVIPGDPFGATLTFQVRR